MLCFTVQKEQTKGKLELRPHILNERFLSEGSARAAREPPEDPRFLGKEAVLGCVGVRPGGPHSGFLPGLPADVVLTPPRVLHVPGSLWPSRDVTQRARQEVQMLGL